jgi:hypothetical protein
VAALPCHDGTPSRESLSDDRGNQYVFIRHPAYYVALAFSTRRSTASHGPSFLWRPGLGTLVLSDNGDRPCWETRAGTEGTGKAAGLARVREGRGGCEVVISYEGVGLSKTYVFRPDEIDVQIGRRGAGGRALSERVPLFLREEDVLRADYGTCPAGGMNTRVLGLVTKELWVERDGRRVLGFDFGAPVEATLRPSYEEDGIVRAELAFALPAIYFGRTGYRVLLNG